MSNSLAASLVGAEGPVPGGTAGRNAPGDMRMELRDNGVLKAALDMMGVGLCLVDAEGVVLDIDGTTCSLLGWSAVPIHGQSVEHQDRRSPCNPTSASRCGLQAST